MKRFPRFWLILVIPVLVPTARGFVDDVRWLADNQRYDLILNPATIAEMTDYPFIHYEQGGEQRLMIDDRRDGLWRVNEDLVFFQSTANDVPLADIPGDQHTLSFNKARNVLIENLDIYAHSVEEALKFSSCVNILVRNCRIISSRTSEDAVDIVRGENYIFDRVWIIGLGVRSMTIKGSARYVDVIESRVGLEAPEDFSKVFRISAISIGNRLYGAGEKLLPKETVPSWIQPCLLFTSDRSLGIEIGGWSDYDIGFINNEGGLESRPLASDIRIDSQFTDPMNEECDRQSDLVPVLQWHTAERVVANAWIFEPTETSVFGDLVEDLYYSESEPGAAREAEIRETLGPELDYWGVERPRYALQHQEYGNNRFFGTLYNFDDNYLFSPLIGWLYAYRSGPLWHDSVQPGIWFYHYPTGSWFLLLEGETLASARWYNAPGGAYFRGALIPE